MNKVSLFHEIKQRFAKIMFSICYGSPCSAPILDTHSCYWLPLFSCSGFTCH